MLRGFQLAGSHRFAADSLADPQYAGQNSLVQWKANLPSYEKRLIVRLNFQRGYLREFQQL